MRKKMPVLLRLYYMPGYYAQSAGVQSALPEALEIHSDGWMD
jgi:hypothetical protein